MTHPLSGIKKTWHKYNEKAEAKKGNELVRKNKSEEILWKFRH